MSCPLRHEITIFDRLGDDRDLFQGLPRACAHEFEKIFQKPGRKTGRQYILSRCAQLAGHHAARRVSGRDRQQRPDSGKESAVSGLAHCNSRSREA